MHFLEWNALISIKNSLKCIPKGPINRWEAIISTNDVYFTDAFMRHLASMSKTFLDLAPYMRHLADAIFKCISLGQSYYILIHF